MSIHPLFPGKLPPAIAERRSMGAAREVSLAGDLLDEVRRNLSRDLLNSDHEHELEVYATAVTRLSAARTIADEPGAVDAATIEEALVLADLMGQGLRHLPASRRAAALPAVLGCLVDAITDGPEPNGGAA